MKGISAGALGVIAALFLFSCGRRYRQETADRPLTREDAIRLTQKLMRQWQERNPDRDWVAEEKRQHEIVPPADNSDLVGKNAQGHLYGEITREDVQVWARETEKLVTAGSRIFHSADELGSPIKVSCDMCHPHAANTHPETYPKFQVQIGQTILLRDMINWCLEHPVRGKAFQADDPKMRALEAYIYAQRTGTPLRYGRR